MIIFKEKYKPLTVTLLFKMMLLSLVLMIVIPFVIGALSHKLVLGNYEIVSCIAAISISIGLLSYIFSMLGLICAILETSND